MWRELIETLAGNCEFEVPTSEGQIADIENALGIRLPEELKELFGETNGVTGKYGMALIWPAERIREDNLAWRTRTDFKELYMPFDPLLFFADAGDGDQFAFAILNGAVRSPDIYMWNHENDSRTWVASSLRQYLERLTNGELEA